MTGARQDGTKHERIAQQVYLKLSNTQKIILAITIGELGTIKSRHFVIQVALEHNMQCSVANGNLVDMYSLKVIKE